MSEQRVSTVCTRELEFTRVQLRQNQIRLELTEMSVVNAILFEYPSIASVTIHLSDSKTALGVPGDL